MEHNQKKKKASKLNQSHGNKEQTAHVQRGGGRGLMRIEGKRSSPKTCIKDTWTQTTGWRIEYGRCMVDREGKSNGEKWGQL